MYVCVWAKLIITVGIAIIKKKTMQKSELSKDFLCIRKRSSYCLYELSLRRLEY